MSDITYYTRADGSINVRVEKRIAGVICKSKGGVYHFRAKGGAWGETFPTVDAVKASLERGQ